MKALWRFKTYLCYLWKANTLHGTHSPFVYRLLEEVVYKKDAACEKNVSLPEECSCSDKHLQLIKRLVFDYQEYILLSAENEAAITHAINAISPKGLLVITGIRTDKKAELNWKAVQKSSKVIVSIDLFSIGLCFFHEGQVKEDFTIRY